MKGLQFTTEEKQLLIEALLFTSCSEICSDHTDVHRLKMISLAEKINDPANKLYNIYTYKTDVGEDKFTDIVLEKFTNLSAHDIITD